MRVVIVRQRGERAEPVVNAWISANRTDSEELSPSQTLKSIESRVGDRGFWLQTSYTLAALSYGEAERLKGGSRDPGREGSSSA
jgi:hypothetical protein